MLDNLRQKLKDKGIGARRRDVIADSLRFAKEHKNCIIMVIDSKKDDLIMVHKNYYIATRIKTKVLKFNQNLVKTIINGREGYRHCIFKVLSAMQEFMIQFVENKLKVGINKNKTEKSCQNQKKSPSLTQPEQKSELIPKKSMGKTIKSWLKDLQVKLREELWDKPLKKLLKNQ